MPYFRYEATDSTGRRVDGTIHAASAQSARDTLSQRGFQSVLFQDPASRVAPPAHRPAPTPAQVASSAPGERTDWGTEDDLMFLFSQLGAHIRSGINPAEACHNLSLRAPRKDYARALEEMSRFAAEGRGLSTAMARWPYLFPPHVIGTVRVGELAGVLPEACDRIAEQSQKASGLRRMFWWISLLAWGTVVASPIGYVIVVALARSVEIQGTQGSSPRPADAIADALRETIFGVPGLAVALALLGLLGVRQYWRSMRFRANRHRSVTWAPLVGARTRSEAIESFSWALAHVSRAALAPRTAFVEAMNAIPNLWLLKDFEAVASRMTDKSPISENLKEIRWLPPELVPLIATGEMTGDIGSQMRFAVESARSESEFHTTALKSRIGCWVLLIYLMGTLIASYFLYGVFYPVLMRVLLGE